MTLDFWKATGERAVKTFAQALLALLGTGSVGITSLDWLGMGQVAATAAVASVLTSLASLSTVVPVAVSKPADAPASVEAPAAPATSFAATQAKIDAAAVTLPDVLQTPAA